MTTASDKRLRDIARDTFQHRAAGTIPLTNDIMRVPASAYTDEARFKLEIDRIFKRVPLLLATTAELKNNGDYKAMEAVGVPLIIVRGHDGVVRAFVNMCSHRGAQLAEEGRGNAKRFSCPYHAWTYSTDGALIGIFREAEFGTVDRSCNGLTALPATERAGLIWVTLNPDSKINIDDFFAGYDELLEHFDFKNWYYFGNQTIPGPNWKVAYDGYMDFYHLPILHRRSFGPDMSPQAIYHAWGAHQRVVAPDPRHMGNLPESEWTDEVLTSGVWTIFPHISIAGCRGGGRGVILSQLFPGKSVDTSYTVQHFLKLNEPKGEAVDQAKQEMTFFEHVVRNEDYATGIKLQKSLATGAKSHIQFGRNEAGGQRFHKFVEELLETNDENLTALLRRYAAS